jgi:hypothetical protein
LLRVTMKECCEGRVKGHEGRDVVLGTEVLKGVLKVRRESFWLRERAFVGEDRGAREVCGKREGMRKACKARGPEVERGFFDVGGKRQSASRQRRRRSRDGRARGRA